MGLFKEENFTIIVDPEVKLIPEFEAIIKKDKSKNKEDSRKIFAYIYHVHDFGSKYNIYTIETRTKKVESIFHLEHMKFSDPLVLSAIDKYVELNETPITKTLSKTKEVLLTAVDVLEKIRLQINIMTDVQDLDVATLASAMGLITNCLTLAERIPKNVKILGDLEDQVRKDLANVSKIRGGGKVNSFEE